MKNLILGICLLIFAALASCKVDVDPTTDINTVEFTIKTDDDSLAKGATVLIYGSEEAYKTAYANFDTSGSTAMFRGKAIDGKFKQDLISNKTYWIRIFYLKPNSDSLFSENALYSNDGVGVQFGPFESNNFDGTKITTQATITLSKAYSFLIVAAKDTSNINVEVYNSAGKSCQQLSVFNRLSKSGIKDLNQFPNIKNSFDKYSKSYLVYVVPKGKIKIYYKNSFGCVNTIEKFISGGGSEEKELLESCNSANIIFFNKTSKLNDIKIILLNPSDTIGTISTLDSNSPTCDALSKGSSYIKVSRPLGVYNFIATSKQGNCEIRGFVTLSNVGECKFQEINLCK